MKKQERSGARTLLLSVLMSAPGPLVMGLGLLAGRSATQLADFVRRSAELLGIIAAYAVYRLTHGDGGCDEEKKERLERLSNLFVGAMMCLGGGIMLALAVFDHSESEGSVLPSLIIAGLGLVANTLFWRKYTRLNRTEPNVILAVQARLYRAKSLVDGCVAAALLTVTLFPGSAAVFWLDRIGSAVVAAYLVYCGARTIRERLHPNGGKADR